MTTYDAWIESEPPEDKDALIEDLEREVEWLRGLIEAVEESGACGRYGEEPGCPFCRAEKPTSAFGTTGPVLHEPSCPAFTPDGKVRSKFL